MNDLPLHRAGSPKAGRTAPGVILLGLCVLLSCGFLFAAPAAADDVRFQDLPAPVQQALTAQGVPAERFPEFIRLLHARSTSRMIDGESEQLAYFILQSNRFTKRPRIDPALSARTFVEKLDPAERERFLGRGAPLSRSIWDKLPPDVLARMNDFLQAAGSNKDDGQLSYFPSMMIHQVATSDLGAYLKAAYLDSMWVLYRKERPADAKGKEAAGAAAAVPYQQRGFSTDTQVEANYPVWLALAVLAALPGPVAGPARINNVLIVGPGLAFAPRAALQDAFDPQSHQPFAVADALLRLKLADRAHLRVMCVDLSLRVVRAIQEFAFLKKPQLNLVSGLRKQELASEFADYFGTLGAGIGTETEMGAAPAALDSHWKKAISVRADVAQVVSAWQLDIVTGRLPSAAGYDLVVVTNVFPYFNAVELMLALANIGAMMKPGGYLIHNELRPEVESYGRMVGLVPLQTRTIRLSAPGVTPPLFDSFVIQEKK